MKVVAFNGSARKESNTALLIGEVFSQLEADGIETELINLRGSNLHGCLACFECFSSPQEPCAIKNDNLNEYVEKMREADGIILGSPSYFANVSTEMKALIDRAGLLAFSDPGMLKHKVGASVAVARRIGSAQVLNQLNTFFSCFEMFTVNSSYPAMAIAQEASEALQDEMGIETMRTLGKNMSFLLKKLHA